MPSFGAGRVPGWPASLMALLGMLALAGAHDALADAAPPEADLAPILTDDGLYTQPWFLQSFLDIGEDLEETAAQGKRFAIMWELKGCPYCRETHFVNFADPEIRAYVRENFVILQLDFLGARMVTDFDGEELAERDLRQKYGVRYTPTFQFFPASRAEIGGAAGSEVEVARMQGYFQPEHFLAMFQYVREKAYEDMSFKSYLDKRMSAAEGENR